MRIRHLLKIIGVFFVLLIAFSFLAYGIQHLILKEDVTFSRAVLGGALYVMGYGDSVTACSIMQGIMAFVGMIGLNILAAYITVNLFWRVKDVSFSNAIRVISKKGKYYLSFDVENKGADIINFQASISFHKHMSKSNIIDVHSKAWSYPIIKKGEIFPITVALDDDELLRERLRSMLFFRNDMEMIATISYADSRTGYESVRIKTYTKDKITAEHQELFDWLKNNAYPLDLGLLRPINEGTIKLQHNVGGGIQATINFALLNDRCEHPDFVMAAFINKREPWEWNYKFRRNAFLNITMQGTSNIDTVMFEVKTIDDRVYQKEIPVTVDMVTNAIKFSDLFLSEYQCVGIKEVCLTIKKEYINTPDTEATLIIKRIEIVLPGQPEDYVDMD